MAPLVQPHPAKEDDITAVLGRFKAWNTAIDAHQEQGSDAFTGLEEISYEEALGDRGARRMLPREVATPQVDLATSTSHSIDSAKDTVVLSAASQLKALQASGQPQTPQSQTTQILGNTPSHYQGRAIDASDSFARGSDYRGIGPVMGPTAGGTMSQATGQTTNGQTATAAKSTATNMAVPSAAALNGADDHGVSPPHRQTTARHADASPPQQALRKPKKAPVRASHAMPPRAENRRSENQRAGARGTESKASASPARKSAPKGNATTKTAAPAKSRSKTLSGQLAASTRTQPTFKAVLEDRLASDRRQGKSQGPAKPAARTTPAVATRGSLVPWVPARSVSLKLKISAGEHAAIKAGAGEAGLPLAAYMRQCTLDVEVLRKLLKQTIADIRAADLTAFEAAAGRPLLTAPAEAAPQKPSRPGLLRRLKNAFLDRDPEAGV